MFHQNRNIFLYKIALLSASLWLLSGCATKQDYALFQGEVQSDINLTTPVVIENKIAPHDRLSIRFYKHPELSTRVDTVSSIQEVGLGVSEDGTVVFPMIGSVQLVGLTREEASALLMQKYALYIKNPSITVEILNQRIYVVGEVNRPGVVPITNETIHLMEAIARAGDFNIYGQRNSVMILRGDLRRPEIKTVNLSRLATLNAQDLILRSGDIVYVQPNEMRATNVNIGEYSPAIQLINNLITPFVNIKYLTR